MAQTRSTQNFGMDVVKTAAAAAASAALSLGLGHRRRRLTRVVVRVRRRQLDLLSSRLVGHTKVKPQPKA